MFAARTVLLLTLLLAFSLHHTAGHTSPRECCDRYARKTVRVTSFYKTPQGCSLPAVVLVTATGDTVCANPNKTWVKTAIENLQRKK
ncbi:C-C motif chemokine 17 [Melopsittacus undulatus]|uniref:C-C motif chemokine 17 n=1 Tax=Melopsittacus undulatus TaxID=13146 RepID=UPI000661AE14|nr:C-C motif chemokine 4-like [Melopsittacus undulatus]